MRGTSREKESTLFEAIFEAICQTMRTHENHAEMSWGVEVCLSAVVYS